MTAVPRSFSSCNYNLHSLEDLERYDASLEQAAIQRLAESERTELLDLTSNLVNLYANIVIMPSLNAQYKGHLRPLGDWYQDMRRYVRLSYLEYTKKQLADNIDELMQVAEQIAEKHGLTSKQWNELVFLSVTLHSRNWTQTEQKTLARVEELAKTRLKSLEKRETVVALVNAIRTHAKKAIIQASRKNQQLKWN